MFVEYPQASELCAFNIKAVVSVPVCEMDLRPSSLADSASSSLSVRYEAKLVNLLWSSSLVFAALEFSAAIVLLNEYHPRFFRPPTPTPWQASALVSTTLAPHHPPLVVPISFERLHFRIIFQALPGGTQVLRNLERTTKNMRPSPSCWSRHCSAYRFPSPPRQSAVINEEGCMRTIGVVVGSERSPLKLLQ